MILQCQHCGEDTERSQYREKITCFKCRRKEQNEYHRLRREQRQNILKAIWKELFGERSRGRLLGRPTSPVVRRRSSEASKLSSSSFGSCSANLYAKEIRAFVRLVISGAIGKVLIAGTTSPIANGICLWVGTNYGGSKRILRVNASRVTEWNRETCQNLLFIWKRLME